MRVALVTPWYGRELLGGAERLAWDLSHALVASGADVTVLTTTCRSFLDDWSSNYHRAGRRRTESGVVLQRFRVDARDRVAFNRANNALTGLPRIALRTDRSPLDARLTRAFVGENVNSRALLEHLREHATSYDAIVFLPYLYGTTLNGLPLVAERSALIPCLHDEAYAYLDPVRAIFAAVRVVLWNSPGEEEAAAAIYGPGVLAKSRVIGHAVDPIARQVDPVPIGGFAPHRSRYVLYLGRQDQSKNIDFLIAAFRAFRSARMASSLQLVLAGPRAASHSSDGILDLGPVDERVKAQLLTYARALAQPSLHESFSRSVYESWHARRPVLVHADCRATARAVEDAGGGWTAGTLEDWVRAFTVIDESADETIDTLGERGWAAALENGSWDLVARRMLEALGERFGARRGLTIEQIVPLGEREVARYAEALVDAVRAGGANSEIRIAGSPATPGALALAHVVRDVPARADIAIAHHGDAASALPPSASLFAASHAVAAQLEEAGIATRVLPLAVSPAPWDGLRPAHERWYDGRATILSIAPLERDAARRILDVFVSYLGMVRDARLLVFADDCEALGKATLSEECEELDLRREVAIVGDDPAERYAAYRAATTALAIGNGLTVERAVTALWFDLPIVALAEPGASETIEPCGLLIDEFDPRRIAALLRIVGNDRELRAALIGEGRRARARHSPRAVAATLLEQLRSDEGLFSVIGAARERA